MSDIDHERIWLQPPCCAEYEERLWCQDAMNDCDEGNPDTEYVRADLYESLQARVVELGAMLEEAYEDGWCDGRNSTSVTGEYTPDWEGSETYERIKT